MFIVTKQCWIALQTFTAPATANYLFVVAGGQGGATSNPNKIKGGLGATVTATVFLTAGATVPIIVAGQGSPSEVYGGGGWRRLERRVH